MSAIISDTRARSTRGKGELRLVGVKGENILSALQVTDNLCSVCFTNDHKNLSHCKNIILNEHPIH